MTTTVLGRDLPVWRAGRPRRARRAARMSRTPSVATPTAAAAASADAVVAAAPRSRPRRRRSPDDELSLPQATGRATNATGEAEEAEGRRSRRPKRPRRRSRRPPPAEAGVAAGAARHRRPRRGLRAAATDDLPTSGRPGDVGRAGRSRLQRSRVAVSVLKRLIGKGYPAFLVNPSAGATPASTGCRSAATTIGRGRAGLDAHREGRAVQVLDYALALLSGALLALSFPKFGHPACAWLALTPLVVAVVRAPASPHRAPRFLLGLADRRRLLRRHALLARRDDDDVRRACRPPAPSSRRAARRLPLAVSRGLRASILARLHARFGPRGAAARPVDLGRDASSDGSTSGTAFPWALLGYSQVTVLPIAQLAASSASTVSRRCSR